MVSRLVSCPLMDLLLNLCSDIAQGQALPVALGWCSCRWGRLGRQLAPPQLHISPGRPSCRRGTWPARRGDPAPCTAHLQGDPCTRPSRQASSLSQSGSLPTQVILGVHSLSHQSSCDVKPCGCCSQLRILGHKMYVRSPD